MDTTDFLNKLNTIQQPLPENSILFTMNADKLYPSVPNVEGIEACKKALESRTNTSIHNDIIDMIELALDGNTISLGDRTYRQTDGVAIGSKLGKHFACAYMREWDEKLLESDDKPMFFTKDLSMTASAYGPSGRKNYTVLWLAQIKSIQTSRSNITTATQV